MTKYVIKRILMMIPVLIGVSILLFMIQALTPGDPANIVLGQDAPAEEKEEWREENGLNDPIVVQYVRYVKNIITEGDFGTSYRNGKPITDDLIQRWPTTLKTCLLSLAVAALIGIPLGILSALKTWNLDRLCGQSFWRSGSFYSEFLAGVDADYYFCFEFEMAASIGLLWTDLLGTPYCNIGH